MSKTTRNAFFQPKSAIVICLFTGVLILNTSFQNDRYEAKRIESEIMVPGLINSLRNTLSDTGTYNRHVIQGENLAMYPAVRQYFILRGFRPSWTIYNQLNENGSRLISILGHAREYGLEPPQYHLSAILELSEQLKDKSKRSIHRICREKMEIVLTDAVLKFMVNLHEGYCIFDTEFASTWCEILPVILNEGIEHDKLIQNVLSVQPAFSEYTRLQKATQYFVNHTVLTDDWPKMADPCTDTVQSMKPLNLTSLYRYKMLALNLDRLRKQDNSAYHLLYVNIPAYQLKIFKENRLQKIYRIIVGSPQTPTPQFTSRIERIIANPVWNVPQSITTNELLPKIKGDTGYLRRNRFRLINDHNQSIPFENINADMISGSENGYSLRQDASSENALGKVKFIFSNPYAVYLHDTPARALFSKDMRALSHGCIRVQEPEMLAEYLLRVTQSDSTDIQGLIEKGSNRVFSLRSAVPIRIGYITCDTDESGYPNFYKDIYGLDQAEMAVLDSFMGI